MTRRVYGITVTGEMDELLCDQFDDVDMTVGHGVSRLRVVCADPSVLHGVLHHLAALGLELLDVRTIDEPPVGEHERRVAEEEDHPPM